MSKPTEAKRTRKQRNYPAWTFEQSLSLAEAIQQFASGEKVNRLTLFKALERFETAFECAIKSIPIFTTLYETYRGKKLPAHEVFADTIREKDPDVDNPKECIDIFVVNCRYLGLLQSIAGAETLVSEDARRDELRRELPARDISIGGLATTFHLPKESDVLRTTDKAGAWDEKCFYITPIGDDGSDERRHSDLYLSYLVEPALRGLKLSVVRADQIGNAGLIT